MSSVVTTQSSPLKGISPHLFGVRSDIGNSLRYATPKIHPSTCATARSGGVSSGLRNAASVPSWSARESQAAMLAPRHRAACSFRLQSSDKTNKVLTNWFFFNREKTAHKSGALAGPEE